MRNRRDAWLGSIARLAIDTFSNEILFVDPQDSTKLPIPDVRNGSQVNITGFSLRENDVDGINWVIKWRNLSSDPDVAPFLLNSIWKFDQHPP